MLFYSHLVWSRDLLAFFGPESWFVWDIARDGRPYPWSLWSIFWITNSPALIWVLHLIALVVFALLVVGYRTRLMAVLAWIFAMSYAGRAFPALFGLDVVNLMLAMYLIIGPSGDCYSVDRWLAKRRGVGQGGQPSISANIAIRLMQIHLCVIYFFSGIGKLQGTAWWDGTAMWMSVANLEYQSLDMTWLADWPRLAAFLTLATVYWETFYAVLVWHRLTRPLMLITAVLVHGGIALALGMATFGIAMIIANMAFLSSGFIRSLVDPLAAKIETKPGQGRGVEAENSGERQEEKIGA